MAPFATINTMILPGGRIHPRTRKILACAAIGNLELDIPQGFVMKETNRSPEYLSKFPFGKIPTLETPSGFQLFESTAIAEYVSRKGSASAQLLGRNDEESSLIRAWVCFGDAHLLTATSTLCGWRMGYGAYDAAKEASTAEELRGYLGVLEAHLKSRTWFVGDGNAGPSLADICLADIFYLEFMLYMDAELRKEHPAIIAWYERVRAVPGLAELYSCEMVDVRKSEPS